MNVERLRQLLVSAFPSGAQVVAEAGGWSVRMPDLPVTAEGATADDAVSEMIEALREYADNWPERLLDRPNHRNSWGLVQLIGLSNDDQLRDWLVGPAVKL